ncbi:MAG: peptidase domain-containing ABC transporter [Leptolyngbya sp. BL-A-14]
MRYPAVLQHSEEDCGAACLATIAQYYGRIFALNRMRELIGNGQLGTTLLGLRRGAETLGFNAQAAKATDQLIDQLHAAPLPMIIHWKGIHWLVLYGQQGKKYVVADPTVGLRYLTRQELLTGWADRVMLLLELDPGRFYSQPSDRVSGVTQILRRIWPYRGILGEALLLNIVIGLFSLAIPFLVQLLTDDVLVRQDTQLLNQVAIAVIVINSLSSALELIQSSLIAHFAQRLELGLVLDFGRQILRLPLTYYESRRSGEVISRLRDIQQINYLVSQVIVNLPSQFLIALVSLGLMLIYSASLTGLAIVLTFLMSVSTVLFLPLLKQKTRQMMTTDAENQHILVETFKGATTLKTINAAPQFWEEFQSRFGQVARLTLERIQIAIFNGVCSRLVFNVGTIALLWVGSTMVMRRELTIGQLLAFNTMSRYVSVFMFTAIGLADEFTYTRVAAQRLAAVIETTSEVSETTNYPWTTIPDQADIVCTKLNFCHPGRVELLRDFCLTIPGGLTTALVGRSGCGKSTLAKLIASLYTLQSGTIRFGPYNQEDLDLECRRQQVVLVPQEAHFWSRSILANFHLAHPHASFESIVQACQITGADEFISGLPDTYQTVLGEFGSNLSGGQRQRLALARALVASPAVLILDESTSALDPISEAEVLDKILFYRQGKTTILISHRPRVIGRADWLVMLDKGQVSIQGKPDNLKAQTGKHLDFLNP